MWFSGKVLNEISVLAQVWKETNNTTTTTTTIHTSPWFKISPFPTLSKISLFPFLLSSSHFLLNLHRLSFLVFSFVDTGYSKLTLNWSTSFHDPKGQARTIYKSAFSQTTAQMAFWFAAPKCSCIATGWALLWNAQQKCFRLMVCCFSDFGIFVEIYWEIM